MSWWEEYSKSVSFSARQRGGVLFDWIASKISGPVEKPSDYIQPAKNIENQKAYYAWSNGNLTDHDFEIDGKKDARVQKFIEDGSAYSIYKYTPSTLLSPAQQEATVAWGVEGELNNNFGKYNPVLAKRIISGAASSAASTASKDKKEARADKIEADWDANQPARLSDMQKDELICRHEAGLLASGLKKCGIETVVASGTLTLNGDKESGAHEYVISAHQPIVYEATSAERPDLVAKYIVNSVTLEDMAQGKPAVTVDQAGNMLVYRVGHSNYDLKDVAKEDQKLIEQYRSQAKAKAAELGHFSQKDYDHFLVEAEKAKHAAEHTASKRQTNHSGYSPHPPMHHEIANAHYHNGFLAFGTHGPDRGIKVAAAQQALKDAGFDIKVDGIFGPKTYETVMRAQENAGLVPNGIWSPHTEDKVYAMAHDRLMAQAQSVRDGHDSTHHGHEATQGQNQQHGRGAQAAR